MNAFRTKKYYATIKTNEVEPSAEMGNHLQGLLSEKSRCRAAGYKNKKVGDGSYVIMESYHRHILFVNLTGGKLSQRSPTFHLKKRGAWTEHRLSGPAPSLLSGALLWLLGNPRKRGIRNRKNSCLRHSL